MRAHVPRPTRALRRPTPAWLLRALRLTSCATSSATCAAPCGTPARTAWPSGEPSAMPPSQPPRRPLSAARACRPRRSRPRVAALSCSQPGGSSARTPLSSLPACLRAPCAPRCAALLRCCPRRYDAVTAAGELRWQNGLSALNAPFFDLADALFVNYGELACACEAKQPVMLCLIACVRARIVCVLDGCSTTCMSVLARGSVQCGACMRC